MIMGAMRSCYSVPVFWRKNQVVPDTMHWYFADRCAGLFPHRHRFQTHYQYPDGTGPNSIGEQPGARPYSKGHGPLGAPHGGLRWQGELEAFINGVPSSQPIVPLSCLTFPGSGLIALPPVWQFGTGEPFDAFNGDTGGVLSEDGRGYGTYSWQAADFASDGAWYSATWDLGSGGMELKVTVNHGGFGHTIEVTGFVFVGITEYPDYWSYEYFYPVIPFSPLRFPYVEINVGKCLP